jgi:NAD(P)-dependent dehydrogenase (short-subunit alcohol dehydrogenase family)
MNVFNGEHNTAGWALRGLTRTAAAEWARFGIHSNLLEIAPDTEEFQKYRMQNPKVIDALLGQVALGRRGDVVEDIGAAAVFAACDESNWINGQVFYADGGQHIAVPAFIPAVQMGFSYAENS